MSIAGDESAARTRGTSPTQRLLLLLPGELGEMWPGHFHK